MLVEVIVNTAGMSDDRGASLLSWTFLEHEEHVRGRAWYTVATIVALVFMTYAFVTRNFFFAVIIVMFAVILYLRHTHAPEHLACALTERGIILGDRFLPYHAIREFWIVDRPGETRTLYANPRGIRPWITIPLGEVHVDRVRAILRSYLPESEVREEPASVAIGRMLKL